MPGDALISNTVTIMSFNGKVLKVEATADHFDIELTQRELAELAGVSLSTVKHYNRKLLKKEAAEIALKKCDLNDFGAMATELYMSKAKTPLEAIGIAYGSLMRFKYGLLKHLGKAKGLMNIGIDVVEAIRMIVSRKDGEANIYRRKGVGNRLHRATNYNHLDKLFDRRESYKNGNSIIYWSLTDLAHEILSEAVTMTLESTLRGCNEGRYGIAPYLYPLCTYKGNNKGAICTPIPSTSNHLTVPVINLGSFRFESVLLTYVMSVGLSEHGLVIPIEHLGDTDEELGRTYNYFTQIKGIERKQLGWVAYDISAAMQTIALQLIDTEDVFPLLSRYTKDNTYKKAVRQQIADETTLSIDDVKQTLTAYANGGLKKIRMHPLLKKFSFESALLMRKTMQHIADTDQDLLQQARGQSKKAETLPDDVEWITDSKDYNIERAKSSVFFFVWTWYERKIRQAMMELLPDGIEVHDAVYSQLEVNTKDLERRVLEKTGFIVTIEKE